MSALLHMQALHILGYGAIIVFFHLLERWRPVERQSWHALTFNACLGLSIYVALTGYFYLVVALRDHLVSARGAWLGLADFLSIDLDPMAFVRRLVIFVLTIDLLQYWIHRAFHRVPFLWRLHKIHHSDRNLNSSTTVREQWLAVVLGDMILLMAGAALFGGSRMPLAVTAGYTAWGFFAHANIRWRAGLLSFFVTNPQLHRIHHSLLPQHFDKNFCHLFPLFDLVFGTYYRPQSDEFPPTGLAEEQFDTYWQATVAPFVKRSALKTASMASAGSHQVQSALP
jgi:sterol desaturase/sphingolipid hydroxylase (fatty acid hydroxylase superfamily)